VTQHFLPYSDGELSVTDEAARELAILLRGLRPTAMLTHWRHSIHADHEAAHYLTRRALFMASNRHFDLEGLAPTGWAPTYYADNWEDAEGFRPYLYVDISEVFADFERAFKCFAIGRGEGGYPYWDWYEARTRIHGIAIGVQHAQAFGIDEESKRQVRETL